MYDSIIIGAAAFLCGCILTAALYIKDNSDLRRRLRRSGAEERATGRRKFEFSKLILALVLLPYFYAVYIGGRVVLMDVSQLPFLLAFVTCPTATALGFYAWKARAENIAKIEKDSPEDARSGYVERYYED